MPQVAKPRVFPVQTLDPSSPRKQRVSVPPAMAHALRSETRRDIPTHVELDPSVVPFSDELTEQMFGQIRNTVAVGHRAVVATLRRPWNIVGFAVDPGSSTASFQAGIQAIVRGVRAIVPGSIITVLPGFPQASLGQFMGCRCELVVINPSSEGSSPLNRVRGTIWGMSEQ